MYQLQATNLSSCIEMESKAPVRRQIVSTVLGECGFCVVCAKRVFSFRFYDFQIIFICRQFTDRIVGCNKWLGVCKFCRSSKRWYYIISKWSIVTWTGHISCVDLLCWCHNWEFHISVYCEKIRQQKNINRHGVSSNSEWKRKDGERYVSVFIRKSHFR